MMGVNFRNAMNGLQTFFQREIPLDDNFCEINFSSIAKTFMLDDVV